MTERQKQWSYANGKTPEDYQCSQCGASGVRLYRQWNTFVEHIQLLCTACALQDQNKAAPDSPREHTIGYLASAVPCEEHQTYWGHSSVPLAGVHWWERLPVRRKPKVEPLTKRTMGLRELRKRTRKALAAVRKHLRAAHYTTCSDEELIAQVIEPLLTDISQDIEMEKILATQKGGE